MPFTSEEIIEALREHDYVVRPYSGRGMRGKQCVSVSIGSGGLWKMAYELGTMIGVDVLDLEPHTDSLGLGMVAYWPSLPWPDGMAADEEPEE